MPFILQPGENIEDLLVGSFLLCARLARDLTEVVSLVVIIPEPTVNDLLQRVLFFCVFFRFYFFEFFL